MTWLLYSAWILLSLTWAPSPRVGFERWLALLLPTMAYLLALRTRFWESEAFWTYFCVLVGAIVLLSLVQFARDYVAQLLEEPLPRFAQAYTAFVDWFPGSAVPRGTMGQRNVVSMYLVLSLPFVAWTFFRARGRRAVLAFAVLGAGLLLVLLSRTRGAWLGLACAGLYLLATFAVAKRRHHGPEGARLSPDGERRGLAAGIAPRLRRNSAPEGTADGRRSKPMHAEEDRSADERRGPSHFRVHLRRSVSAFVGGSLSPKAGESPQPGRNEQKPTKITRAFVSFVAFCSNSRFASCDASASHPTTERSNAESLPLSTYHKRLAWLAGAAAVAILAALVLKPPESEFGSKADLGKTVGTMLDPEARASLWRKCSGVTNPLLGAGYGNFPILATARMPEAGAWVLDWEVHNDYLQAYIDLGLPGLVLFMSAFAMMLSLAWKSRDRGVILAAGAAITGLAAMQFTTYTSGKVSSLVWFAGVVAIVNSRAAAKCSVFSVQCSVFREDRLRKSSSRHATPDTRQPTRDTRHPAPDTPFSASIPSPSAFIGGFFFPPALLNVVAVIGLLAFAGVTGMSIRADRLFRRTEDKVLSVGAVPAERLAAFRDEVRRELRWIAQAVLPTMQFGAMMRHVYCGLFTRYAADVGDSASAAVFARAALRVHPNDRGSLEYLARLAFHEGRRDEGVALMERIVKTFGYDPTTPLAQGLALIYAARGESDKARELQERINTAIISMPAGPAPGNRATGVPIDTTFDWSDCSAAETYEVYLWKTGEQTPAGPVGRKLKDSEFRPREPLEPDTVYFWRVKAIGRYDRKQSEIWFFRTAKQE